MKEIILYIGGPDAKMTDLVKYFDNITIHHPPTINFWREKGTY